MQCPICQFNCATRASFKHHIKGKHKEVSKLELENLYVRYVLNIEVSFQDIVNDYLLGLCFEDLVVKYSIPRNNIKNILNLSNVKLRSNSESKQTIQYQEKYTSTIKEKYGVENVSTILEVKEKKKQTSLKNSGYINNFCNPIIKENAFNNIDFKKVAETGKKSNLLKYGVENVAQIPEIAEKISKSHLKLQSKYSYEERLINTQKARESCKYESSLELRIQSILDSLLIEYTRNRFLGNYNFDFIFKNKIILEIQGDYWHGNPNKYKENDILFGGKTAKMIWNKDLKKKEFVEKRGFKIFYLWETDINKMTDEEIINFLKEILI